MRRLIRFAYVPIHVLVLTYSSIIVIDEINMPPNKFSPLIVSRHRCTKQEAYNNLHIWFRIELCFNRIQVVRKANSSNQMSWCSQSWKLLSNRNIAYNSARVLSMPEQASLLCTAVEPDPTSQRCAPTINPTNEAVMPPSWLSASVSEAPVSLHACATVLPPPSFVARLHLVRNTCRASTVPMGDQPAPLQRTTWQLVAHL